MSSGMRRQWTRSSRAYLAASAALAILTALMVHHYLADAAAAAGRVGPMTPVVEAAKPVVRGSQLEASSLRVASIPRGYVPPGSFASPQQVIGRVALVDLAAGEAVTETRLARVRAGPVASLIPEGYRAFAVPTSLPPGTVVAGDRVDVLATYGSGQLQADTVIDGAPVVLVLGPSSASSGRSSTGIGLPAGAVASSPQATLILLVTPEQQQRLAFARAFAVLDVSVQPPSAPG